MSAPDLFRITLIVDEEWLNAINRVTSYVESDETCTWVEVERHETDEDFDLENLED